eukprot:6211753-Pleurochrysis_carterae.AAC.2
MGSKLNPKKLQALDQMPDHLQTKKQFIRRIGYLANPLYKLLRKDVKESEWPWKPDATVEACRYKRAYEAERESLRMDVMLAHPDLHDPSAEYVIMTDASDVAADAVMMKWQKRQVHNNEGPPEETPTPTSDTFAATHKTRMAAGCKLQVLGYYSKTFDATQRRWAIFDKEAGSIVMACSHGIDSLRVGQSLCTPTTLWQPVLSATSNVRVRRDSEGGG